MKVVTLRLSILVVSTVLFSACGSGELTDPLVEDQFEPTYGGSLISGFDGPNAPVSEQTKYELCNLVFHPLYDVYYEALKVVRTAPDTGLVRVIGPVNGYAMVTKSLYNRMEVGKRFVAFNASVTFHDFSADNRLFFGGTINFVGLWREIDNILLPYDINMGGGIDFAGEFSGLLTFLGFTLLIDGDGVLMPAGEITTGYATVGLLQISSNEWVSQFSPYPPPPSGGSSLSNH